MDFLLELLEKPKAGYRQELTLSAFKDCASSNCRNTYVSARNYPWFFDQTWNGDYYLVTPTARAVAPFTMLGWFARGAKSWQAWPDLSKGFRGRTYLKGSKVSEGALLEEHGDDSTYVMIPFDKSRLGVSSAPTIEESFSKEPFKDIGTSNDRLCQWMNNFGECLAEAGAQGPLPDFTGGVKTAGELAFKVKQLDKLVKSAKPENAVKFLAHNENAYEPSFVNGARHLLSSYNGDFRRTLQNYMDPLDNGFNLVAPYAFMGGKPVEVWTTDPVLAIRRNKYIDLHKRGELK